MLFKSQWFVLVLVASATPDSYRNYFHAPQHDVEGRASPVFKGQVPSWRNETKTSIAWTTTREPTPAILSSSSSAEPQKSTPISKSDKASPIDGTSTRSLFPGPQASPSASNEPITSQHSDASTSSVAAVGSHSTHVFSSQQQQGTSTVVSSQSPLPVVPSISSSTPVSQLPPTTTPPPSTTSSWQPPSPPASSLSSLVNPTPASQTATSDSGTVFPSNGPSASEQLSTLSSISVGLSTSSSTFETVGQSPSGQIPLSLSTTSVSSQVVSSSLVTYVPVVTRSSSSITALPSPSDVSSVVSNTFGSALSSVLSSKTESSASFSGSETLTASVSPALSASSPVSASASGLTNTRSIGPTGSPTDPTWISSSNTGVVASETFSNQTTTSSVSAVSTSNSGTTSNAVSAGASTVTVTQVPSGTTITPTGGQTTSLLTVSANSATVNTSTNAIANATSGTTILSGLSSSIHASGHSTNTSVVLSTSPSTASMSTSVSISQRASSTLTAALNVTSPGVLQATTTTTPSFQGWNSSAASNAASSTNTFRGAAFSTGYLISPTGTDSNVSQTSPAAIAVNSTVVNRLLSATDGVSASASPRTISNSWTTRTIPTPVLPTASATTTAAAAAPLPALTTPQKAGVVIAGFAGFLLALVAVVYLVRRRYNGRRSSSGSIYPKEAYIYDPRTGGQGGDDHTLMSGGMSGMPLMRDQASAPSSTPEYGHRYSTDPFRDPDDPFQDAQDPLMTTAAAFDAAIRGYGAASFGMDELPATQPSRDMTMIPPTTRAIVRDATADNRGSILSEIASIAYNPRVYPNPHASRYERVTPYGFHSNKSLPRVLEADSNRGIAEQDLPLQVDLPTDTSDYMTLYAPPPISNTPIGATQPPQTLSKNPWASSMLNSVPAQSSSSPLRRVVDHQALSPEILSPNATLVPSERYSLAYDKDKSTTYIAPSQIRSPVSTPYAPINKGWEEFKRYSAEKVVPPPVDLTPPLGYWSQSPRQKQSVPQLRRKEAQLFGSPEATRSNDRLPLRAKAPFSHQKSSSVPNARLDVKDQNDDTNVRSPDTTFQQGLHALASRMHKKKSGDMDYSCAGV